MAGMIDLHCHILAGIDDGPPALQQSIAMARIAAADGISKIAATPHIKNTLHSPDLIRKGAARLNAALAKLRIPVEIVPGAEVYAPIDPLLLDGYTINKSRYILIEFPYTHLPKNAGSLLFKLAARGFRPIICHPERNPSVIRDPDLLLKLMDSNIRVQITAGSLSGSFGLREMECACYLLERGAVSFIATDAHSAKQRPPILSKGVKIAARIIGREKAMTLVTSNPAAVLAGKALYA